jgi:hypothetical protein
MTYQQYHEQLENQFRLAEADADVLRPAFASLVVSLPTFAQVDVYADPGTKQAYCCGDDKDIAEAAIHSAGFTRLESPPAYAVKLAAGRGITPGGLIGYRPLYYNDKLISPASLPRAAVTSGLLGAVGGFGLGAALQGLLPDEYEGKSMKTRLALAGLGIGLAPAAVYGALNYAVGNSPLSAKLTNNTAQTPPTIKAADAGGTAGSIITPPKTNLDVNIDAMGRTLWRVGAPPELAGMTYGALRAASTLPGGNREGWVTPTQLAGLAFRLGSGYLTGAMTGAALGMITNVPPSVQNALAVSGAALNVISSVVPPLFNSEPLK